ncbi:hypothetical protein PA6761_06314 [Pseudomonas aeruginosa]
METNQPSRESSPHSSSAITSTTATTISVVLSCFLTTRPYDLANLDARFLSKTKEGLPLGRLQSQESSDHRQNENTENAIQDWLSRKVLIAHNGNHNQNGNQEPFQEIKT